ncbi:hypothetical protein FG379_002452 [Cryptosporidium bovis]|uniref:uncharacterized protein n=1 Tax=Cryptosporidium bovis TaxID=310047 RepID=UPI00351A9743|nr:hypothetical protein FG379_002452 [Cryptosporidium bovis]
MKVFNILKCLISLIICMLFLSKNDESNLIENSLLKLRKPKCPKLSSSDKTSLERQLKIKQDQLGQAQLSGDRNKIERLTGDIGKIRQRLCRP